MRIDILYTHGLSQRLVYTTVYIMLIINETLSIKHNQFPITQVMLLKWKFSLIIIITEAILIGIAGKFTIALRWIQIEFMQ